MSSDSSLPYIPAFIGTGFGCLIGLTAMILGIVIFWRIFSKAGYSGAMSLLMLIPLVNLIMLCILAFGKWPIYNELEMLRQRANGYPPQGAYPPPQPGYPPQQGFPPYNQG